MIISCRCRLFVSSFILLTALSAAARASEKTTTPAEEQNGTKYMLRYKFTPGQTLRWKVVHRKRIQATYGGSTQLSESASQSTKCWRVKEIDSDGHVVFESLVEDVNMRQKIGKHKPVSYNSKKDAKPPQGFEDAAKRIGKPLARVKLDNRGRTVHREPLLSEPTTKEKPQLTIPLPEKAVAVGESWRERYDVMLPLETGATKKILTQQVFTLKSVKTGVATIEVANQVITPIHSPKIEAKLIERYSCGTVRFDVDAGRILSQQMDLDRRVIGFRGDDSCLHYLTRFTEQSLPEKATVADRAEKQARK